MWTQWLGDSNSSRISCTESRCPYSGGPSDRHSDRPQTESSILGQGSQASSRAFRMSSLTPIDKKWLERALQMDSGYVLSYSRCVLRTVL